MNAVAIQRSALLALLALALGGCPLPPPPASDALRSEALPNTQVPEQWVAGPGAAVGEVADGWLLLFEDAALAQLVAEAMAYNTDLQVAAARVEAAAASARAAGGMLLPQVGISGRGGGKMSGDNSGLQGLGLFANWELDLWGRVRAQRHAAEAQYESAALDAHYARESIAALVAKSWFLAREAAIQRDIASEMVESSQALAEFSRERLRIGKGDELEVAEAETSVLTYSDVMVQAEMARQNALRSIEILAGRYPGATVDVGRDLPPVPGAIPAGLPSQLLERRPDVRAAERRVAAAFYRTKEAQAARLPRIALTAGVSSVSSDLIVLKARDNPMWSVGATLTAPIFTGGALQAQVEARTAEQKAAVAEYGRVGARAFSEVEGALSTAFQLERRADILVRAVQANERAVNFARVRYDVGSGDLRAVRQQMLSLHAARTSLVRAQAERLVQRVNLHLALGGGFEPASQ
ncbi:MAG TPA: TolC family protein [Usitatibacter sp.]|jgi:NodT family efflux transporter outer membrane factor (OMF) lipoprotein|nr:TolC family protein [Usitatibacter sp.]